MKIQLKSIVSAVICGLVLLLWAPSTLAVTPVEVAKLLASDGAEHDQFGFSVAVSDDTAVIGAVVDGPGGSAYVFTHTGANWAQQAKLMASDAAVGDEFGRSVAIDGDTAVVSASEDDSRSGSVYVFTRTGTTWTQQAKLRAEDAAAGDHFGIAVAISGDTVVIGAYEDDDAGNRSGSAYVFTRSGSTWSQQAKLTAADASAEEEFGRSVAVSGNTAVVGATVSGEETEDPGLGSAYVFTRSGAIWSQQAKLTASDTAPGDQFGISVAVTGDTAIVGAYLDDDAGISSGSAYVFMRSGTTWTRQAKLTASDAGAEDRFGRSLAISGDVVVIGSERDDNDLGSARVFARTGSTWTEQAKLTASDAAADDLFGFSVALSGDTAVIGARQDDDAGFSSGSAYVFSLVTDVIEVEIDIKPFAEPTKPNRIRLPGGSRDYIKVAILSTNFADDGTVDFDALQVDPETVEFGPAGAPAKRGWLRVRDVDGDGDVDMILRFKIRKTGITCSDTEATLTGKTYADEPFAGTDSIRPYRCR